MPAEVSSLHYVDARNTEVNRLQKTGVPWHGLGVAHDGFLTDDEAKAALPWRVELRPTYWRDDFGIYRPCLDSQAIVKVVDGNVEKQIATVGPAYEPFQNEEMIELGSVLVDDYGAKWDTVGSLRNDRIVFATLRIDEVVKEGRGLADFDGSDYWSWFLLASSHDESLGLTGDLVKIRTVCMNTFRASKASAKAGWKVKHTVNMRALAEEAHRQMGLVTKADAEFADMAHRLADTAIELEEFEKFTEHLFPIAEKAGERAQKNAIENRQAVTRNWLQSNTIADELRKTRWGAFNAVTEWAEWIKPAAQDRRVARSDRRMLHTMFGGPVHQLRDKAQAYLTKGLD
jgi:phage/plasmid-like protein (TIGR03299 family)